MWRKVLRTASPLPGRRTLKAAHPYPCEDESNLHDTEQASVRFLRLTENRASRAPRNMVMNPAPQPAGPSSICPEHHTGHNHDSEHTGLCQYTGQQCWQEPCHRMRLGSQIWSGKQPAGLGAEPEQQSPPAAYSLPVPPEPHTPLPDNTSSTARPSPSISSVPVISYRRNSPISMTSPPITATAR